MLHEQLVENVNNLRIRECLLLEPELTLQKAISLSTQIETIGEQAKVITGDHSAPVHTVAAVCR